MTEETKSWEGNVPYKDDITRQRQREVEYYRSVRVYDEVPLGVLRGHGARSHRCSVGPRAEEVGGVQNKIRIAKEIMLYDDPSLFAGTPPLEELKCLLSELSCNKYYVMGHVDVSRAYVFAAARRALNVRTAQLGQEPGDDARCGKLKQTMHGTRGAGQCRSANIRMHSSRWGVDKEPAHHA